MVPRFPATRRVVEPTWKAYGCRKTFSGAERSGRPPLRTFLMRPGVLTAYRIATDLTAKAAFLLLTVFAARRLSRDEFGLFALGSAIGWLAGVIGDAGLQLHVARTVAKSDVDSSGWIIRRWLTWRVTAACLALALAAAGVAIWTADSRAVVPLILLIAIWLCNAVTEFLNHLFRGLSRTDVESTVTGVSRIATLGARCCSARMASNPHVAGHRAAAGGGDDPHRDCAGGQAAYHRPASIRLPQTKPVAGASLPNRLRRLALASSSRRFTSESTSSCSSAGRVQPPWAGTLRCSD